MVRRTTVKAQDSDLAVIAQDARARGISLGDALGELVEERASELRAARPGRRYGTFGASASVADLEQQAEDEPAATEYRLAP
ncbi:MAG: hypothetical protein ACRDMJ_12805 [Solirubrobacteraceae bacterium]